MEKCAFGYSQNLNDDVGIYVVCDDTELLYNINTMMRRNGYISVSDTAGRQHYLVDARNNNNLSAVRRVENILVEDYEMNSNNYRRNMERLEVVIYEVLDSYSFDRTLMGSILLTYVLRVIVSKGMKTVLKSVYQEAGSIYGQSSGQVERNIRYAIHKSSLNEVRIKTVNVCQKLVDDIIEIMEE